MPFCPFIFGVPYSFLFVCVLVTEDKGGKGHPQVLKLFVNRTAVISRYSCHFVPLSSECLIPSCSFACLSQKIKEEKAILKC
jgi:hypothetical protein